MPGAVKLKQLAQDGATPDQAIVWNGSDWAPGNPAVGTTDQTANSYTTTGLGDGDWGYVSSANTVSKTDAASEASSRTVGANEGTAGKMTTTGIVENAKFTTDGGSPTNGNPVFLALASADSGAGAGKLTATAPSSGFVAQVGICVDNANYAGAKTCKVQIQIEKIIQRA